MELDMRRLDEVEEGRGGLETHGVRQAEKFPEGSGRKGAGWLGGAGRCWYVNLIGVLGEMT